MSSRRSWRGTRCSRATTSRARRDRGAAAAATAARDPEGYRGYVVLQYALGSCPLLSRREGCTVIRFCDDGRACTSETTVETTLRDRAYYVARSGDRQHEPINFAVAPDPFVIQAIDQCRWEDAKCWEGLRSR